MIEPIFSKEDPVYSCFLCSKRLRYSSKLKCVVATDTCEEHVCVNNKQSNRIPEIGLESQRNEIASQLSIYKKFESTAQLKSLSEYKKGTGRPTQKRGND
jgi:hypothetical protein